MTCYVAVRSRERRAAGRRDPADDLSQARPEQTVLEINDQLKRQNYIKRFPPKGIEIVSW
jgi:hypothetical protein